MSGNTFTLPTEDQGDVLVSKRSQLLHSDSSSSLSLSPDSDRCNFKLSDRGDRSTLSQGGSTSNSDKNQAFISTPDNFFNLNLTNNKDFGASFYQTASEGSAVTSPDSVAMSSCRTSREGSMDFSFSSGEMVVRSNSFCLEEPSALIFSSLEESPAPPASCQIESMLTPHVYEKDGSASGLPCLGTTFIYSDDKVELPSEVEVATSNSFLALPNEKANLHATFLCENSPADSANDAQFLCTDEELQNETKTIATPEDRTTFVYPSCTVQDMDKDIQTSTPLENLGSHVPSLPSFAVSPCVESNGSPAFRSVVRKKSSQTPKQFDTRQTTPASKVAKMEMNKFPNSMFSGIKVNNKPEVHKMGTVRASPTRFSSGTASSVAKVVQNTPRKPKLANNNQINSQNASTVSEEVKSKATPMNDASKTPPIRCSPKKSDGEQATSSIANLTFCIPEKSPPKISQTKQKPTPRNDATGKMKKVISGSAVGQDKSTPSSRPRSSSESSTALARLLKIPRLQRFSASFTLTKTDSHKSKNKPVNESCSSQSKPTCTKEATEGNSRKVKKMGLGAESYTLPAPSSTNSRSRFRTQASPNQGRASTSKAPAASPMTTTPLNKHRVGTQGRERTTSAVGTPLPKQKTITCNHKPSETSHGFTAAARLKTQPSSVHHVQTPSRSSAMGPPPAPVSRLQQRKTFGPNKNPPDTTAPSEAGDAARVTQVSGIAGKRSTPFKAVKARLTPAPVRTNAAVLTTPSKSITTTKGLQNEHISPQKRTTPASKLIRLTASVDKNKPKAATSQTPRPERSTRRPLQSLGGPTVVSDGQRNDHKIQQLQAQLVHSNNRFEAFTVVLEQALAQRDEAVGQCRGLSQELLDLRGELVSSVSSSGRLQQEKEELKAALDQALQQVQEQHHRDLLQLEERLRESYHNEWTTAQHTYTEEAERCKALMEQQIEELRVSHESMKQELEKSHVQQLQTVTQQYQQSLEELRNVHNQELQSLDKTLKDAEMVLSEKIRELTRENDAVMEKLREEENRRRDMSQDSHTVYLEQELESLKVVLDIKNQQLHQQESKLMSVEKLTEKNVKLEESLRKVQQENEDLKARMERHAALSRQLSSEQAVLQESLQKESKVNKRLSMENEELMWKLHNGDMGSPRKLSPGPGSPFSLQSPRSPPVFSSQPLSPR